MQDFLRWFVRLLSASLYPGAPYERKLVAIEMFHHITLTWPPKLERTACDPYPAGVLGGEMTQALIGALVDSWDKFREGARRVLSEYPTPLPGVDTPEALVPILVRRSPKS